jgi:acetylornithine/succinyldiaminopimelate/putrescine aminotransferase
VHSLHERIGRQQRLASADRPVAIAGPVARTVSNGRASTWAAASRRRSFSLHSAYRFARYGPWCRAAVATQASIAAPAGLMARWEPGSHGGTCGGNAVACAAAVATIRVLLEQGLAPNGARMGKELLTRLQVLEDRYPGLGDVRGVGLMVGVEFVVPGGRIPDSDRATAIQQAGLESGLLLLTCGTENNVIRWIPPLTIGEQKLNEALSVFERALDSVVNG